MTSWEFVVCWTLGQESMADIVIRDGVNSQRQDPSTRSNEITRELKRQANTAVCVNSD